MAIQNAIGGVIRKMRVLLGSDATGDVYYRGADETITRLPIGDEDDVLSVSAGALPEWRPLSGLIPYIPMPAVVVTAGTGQLVVNQRVIVQRSATSGLCTLTLPINDDIAVGDEIEIVGRAQDGIRIAQNASQQIVFNSSTSTAGASGYVQTLEATACLKLVAIESNLLQVVYSHGSQFDVV
jgi:hypothetical protein